MRYSHEHKVHSRNKIVKVAARLFRQSGYDGVSIDTLMKAAGLTRGGFYGHFTSKRELYEAVLGGDHDFVTRLQVRSAKKANDLNRQGLEITNDYLHPNHRQGVICGCSLASLAMDTARSSDVAQMAYANVVRQLVDEFRRGLNTSNELDERGLSALATCVGGLLLSGACAVDLELSKAISQASSKLVAKTLGTK